MDDADSSVVGLRHKHCWLQLTIMKKQQNLMLLLSLSGIPRVSQDLQQPIGNDGIVKPSSETF